MSGADSAENIIDLSQIDMPVRLEDRSFDQTMFPQLVEHLKQIRDQSFDYVVPGPKLRFKADKLEGEKGSHSWSLYIDSPEGMKVFKPTDWAEKQTVDKTPMPRKYHIDLLDQGYARMAAANLNLWLRKKDLVMVRTVGDHYRAFVSNGFFAIDNYDLLSQVAKTVKTVNDSRPLQQKPMQFWKVDVSETNLYMDIIDEGRQYDIGKGDLYSAMLVVRNSEVGDHSMSIEPGFFRWRCVNRHIKEPVLRKIHKGEKLDEGIFAADTRQAARTLWQKEVRDVMNATMVDNRLFEKWANELKGSKEVKIEDIPVVVHKVADELNFSDMEEQAILDAMMRDTTLDANEKGTAYAIIQGMSAAAKTFGPDRSYEVSKVAGNTEKLLTLIARAS